MRSLVTHAVVTLVIFAFAAPALAEARFVHKRADGMLTHEHVANFALVYGAQWSIYLVTQHENVEENGSFKNWRTYPFSPVFDKDGFDYNLIKHTLAGQYYYLFFRSRGYTEVGSFLGAMASSLAFEFTVETLTERPSIQDMYQTPILGTVAGMGAEWLSLRLHSLETWPARLLGYLVNPFTLLPFSRYGFEVAPVLSAQTQGAALRWRF